MNTGKPRQAAVHLHHRALHPPPGHPPRELTRNIGGAQRHGAARVGVADDGPGGDTRSVGQRDALPRDDGRDRHAGDDHGAPLLRRPGQRERDSAHPALHIPPCAPAALQPARSVHDPDRRGAGIAGADPGAGDALPVQRGPQPLVLDVAFHHIGDGFGEHQADEFGVVAEQVLDLRAARCLAQPGVTRALPQRPPHPREQLLVAEQPGDIAGSDRGHLRRAARVVVPQRQRRAVLERAPQMRVHAMDRIAVLSQPELAHHDRVQQAHNVGAGADQVAGVGERPGQRAGTADLLAGLQDQHRPPHPGQVGGGREPVVPGTHHHRVPAARPQISLVHARRA